LNFYTVTGQRLAQKRGGIDKRVHFFVEALREIEEYC
jgi:hypothetical protein